VSELHKFRAESFADHSRAEHSDFHKCIIVFALKGVQARYVRMPSVQVSGFIRNLNRGAPVYAIKPL
jgi:hypothetical protein